MAHKRFVIFDFHSYNHRRNGPDKPEADSPDNPQINLGTGSMDRKYWTPVVNAFLKFISGKVINNKPVDIRENIKIKGGYLAQWVHDNFPETGCVLSIECKKVFMDEWSGKVNSKMLDEYKRLFASSAEPVLSALKKVRKNTVQLSLNPW
jgi:hypothetical protein